MTARTISLVFHVKGFLSVVAFAAKIPLVDQTHFHLVGSLGNLKNLVVASSAFQPFAIHMLLMTENDG